MLRLSLLRLRAVLALRRGVGLLARVLLLALEAGLRGVGLLARLAELVQHGGGRVQRSDLAFLQLEEQDHASRTQSNREQREQVEADREVNQIVIVGEDVERLDKRDDSQSERTRAHRNECPLLVGQPVGDADADVREEQEQEDDREPTAAAEKRRRFSHKERDLDIGKEHRDKHKQRRSSNADQRVGRANRATAHLASLSNDSVLELIERAVRGGTELRSGGTKLLASGRPLLTGLPLGSAELRLPLGSAIRLLSVGLLSLRSALRSAIRLLSVGLLSLRSALGSAVLRLPIGLLGLRRIRLRGGSIRVSSGFSGCLLMRALGGRVLMSLSRGLGGGCLSCGLRGGRLSGNDTLAGKPLLEGRVQRRVSRNVGAQVFTRGRDGREVLSAQRRVTHVSSSELRRIDGAHLYSSRTRKCSS